MNNSFINLLKIHFLEYKREPAVLFWTIIFPVALSLVLGVSFSKKDQVFQRAAIIIDLDKDNFFLSKIKNNINENNTLIYQSAKGQNSYGFHMKFDFVNREEAFKLIKKGLVSIILEPYNNNIRIFFDKNNSQAELAFFQLKSFLAEKVNVSYEIVSEEITVKGGRYIDFLLPGLICLGIMNSALWGIGWSFIELRIKKLLRRMVAAPMKKSEFLASHFISRVIMAAVEMLILCLFGYFYFNITISGSLYALIAVFICGNLAFSGIAVLVGSRAQNSRIGNGLINAVSIPMLILSGIFFSYINLPEAIHPVIKALPLTQLADSLRLVFNEGANFLDVWFSCVYLSFIGFMTSYFGLKIFKWY
ncbi:MAG: ABC transporter permease [Spirochaetia bacterium]|nr:ABC transporter permease [Spirochaetia bacterium]